MCRSLLLSFALVHLGGALPGQQPPALPQKGAGPGKPLSSQEARSQFKLDDGLRIELVACEPQIESPVAMAFDPDGRLWVVEMRDYPNGPAAGERPAGRIRILDDKDGDGFFETATTWAENLPFANGLLLWKQGAIVTMAPEIIYLENGRPARSGDNVHYRGFAEQNPQLRVSHPILGLDGWITCANGLRGGKVTVVGQDKSKRVPIDLSGMDFRLDPTDPAQYQATTGPGQYGNTFDEWGNRFVCDNRHHLRHVVMENRYLKGNPALAAPTLLEDISVLDDGPLSSGGKIYPISKNWTTSSLHEGRFTAACGVFIYQGNLLDANPKRDRGVSYRGAAFTCDPTGNLVHMETLTPKGATFTARPHKHGVEFLATADDWFRPVFLSHGADGAMYVVDMYRAVIEHPEFMPPELKNRPDLAAGKDKGRIWRIVPANQKKESRPRPNLSEASPAQLVKSLEHEEPWWRATAQRLLLENGDVKAIEPLKKLLHNTKSPHAKILAAWLLNKSRSPRPRQLDVTDLAVLLTDSNPRVVEHAIKIAEPWLKGKPDERLAALVSAHLMSIDARIRYQAILSTNEITDPALAHLRTAAAWASRDDRWSRLAVQCTSPIDNGTLLTNLLLFPMEDTGGEALLHDLGATMGTQGNGKQIYEPFSMMAAQRERAPSRWAGLDGVAVGLERRGKTLASLAKDDDVGADAVQYRKDLADIMADAEKLARDANLPEMQRLRSIRFLGHAPWPVAKGALAPLVEKEPSVAVRLAAARALAFQQNKEVPALLLTFWPNAAPAVRREILEGLLRQSARVPALLDAIEAKRVRISEIDPLRVRQLSNLKDVALRERAKTLFAGQVSADRVKVLAEYQPALSLKTDGANGREIFKKNCAACHRVAGIGVDVGPDIADTRTKTLGALLNDILVPNAAIDANYVNYVVTTKSGRTVSGLLGAETATSVTLMRAEKQVDVVLRSDIDEIASTGVSLMPDGFEKSINVQEMADLLRFLKDWRYMDGSVPLAKEKH